MKYMINRIAILLMLLAPLATYGQTNTSIEKKMKAIIIPAIEFRQANAIDVLNFLVDVTTGHGPEPDVIGFGHLSTNIPPTREYYTFELEDGTPLEFHPLTLNYEQISMFDAIDRITKMVGITYRIEKNTPVFFTHDGKSIIRKKHVEQAGPGYPPQGVGSPDP